MSFVRQRVGMQKACVSKLATSENLGEGLLMLVPGLNCSVPHRSMLDEERRGKLMALGTWKERRSNTKDVRDIRNLTRLRLPPNRRFLPSYPRPRPWKLQFAVICTVCV